MDIGKFYGLTAPMAILADLPIGRFKNVVRILNNPVDCWILRDFSYELKNLQSFLNNNVTLEYTEPKARKTASIARATRHYLETGVKLRPTLFTEEELMEAEEYLKTCQKSVINRIKIGEEYINLSIEETKIIETLYNKRYNIDLYLNSLQINSFTEVRVFGNIPLYNILSWDPKFLYFKVQSLIKKAMNNKNILISVLERCKEDCGVMQSFITSENTEDAKRLLSGNPHTLFDKFVTNHTLVEADREIFYLLNNKHLLFKLTEADLKFLIGVFRLCKNLDVEFFNKEFDLELSRNDYEAMFDKLDSLGLIGLNLYCYDFSKQMLDSVTFEPETKLSISSDSELVTVLEEIEAFCVSELTHVGDEIA